LDSENFHECTENAKNGFSFDFLGRCHKDSYEFLNHMITGDETLVSFENVRTKEQSKQWMHTHSPNNLKRFKQMSEG
jgi:hypothetical protein